MGRIKRSWILTKKSWQVLKGNRSLLLFPVLAFVCGAGAVAILAVPAALLVSEDAPQWAVIAIGIVALYVFTFFTVFFNVALAGAVSRQFDGQRATVSDGLAIARKRVGAIAAWALVSTTVGVAIRALEERLPLAGQIAAWLVGAAWAVVTFFVVPVLALEGVGAGRALKRSATIFKERWGEQFGGRIAIGAILVLVAIPVVVVGAAGIYLTTTTVALGVALIVAAAICLAILVLISSAMTQIFGVALYRYATEGTGSGPFSDSELQTAFAPKRRRRWAS